MVNKNTANKRNQNASLGVRSGRIRKRNARTNRVVGMPRAVGTSTTGQPTNMVTRMKFSDQLAVVPGTSAGNYAGWYKLFGIDSNLFSFYNEAKGFSQYRIVDATIKYVPMCGTDTPGEVRVAVLSDSGDGVAWGSYAGTSSGHAYLLSEQVRLTTSPFLPAQVSWTMATLPALNAWYACVPTSATDKSTARDTAPYSVAWSYYDAKNANMSPGYLMVEFTVEFRGRVNPNLGLITFHELEKASEEETVMVDSDPANPTPVPTYTTIQVTNLFSPLFRTFAQSDYKAGMMSAHYSMVKSIQDSLQLLLSTTADRQAFMGYADSVMISLMGLTEGVWDLNYHWVTPLDTFLRTFNYTLVVV